MAYIYDLTDTWSAGGTTFNAIKMNVTDSASAVSSKLVSLQTNGTEHFSVTKAGVGYVSGNFGVGTASPLYKLDVNGDANFGSTITTGSGVSTGDVRLELGSNRSAVGNTYMDFHSLAGQDYNSRIVRYGGTNSAMEIVNAGAGSMAFATDNQTRMSITGTGNVGIGTSAPTFRLVAANNNFDGVGIGSSSTYSLITLGGYFSGTAGAAQIGYERSTGAFTFGNGTRDAPTESMRINSAGDVGIGTIAPAGKLHVAAGENNSLLFRGPINYATGGSIYAVNEANSVIHPMELAASSFFLTGGNVGIGVVSATYQLQIQGLGQDTAALTDAGNKGGSLYLRANGNTSGSGGALLFGTTFGNQTPFAAIKSLVIDGGTNTIGDLAFSTRNATSDTALTERMRISASGNVGIGTSPSSDRLNVSGNGQFTNASYCVVGATSGAVQGQFAANAGGSLDIRAVSSHPMTFYTNNQERGRFEATGFFKVGTTTDFPGLANNVSGVSFEPAGSAFISRATSNIALFLNRGGDGTIVSIRSSGTEVGSISFSGSTTSYNTSSDYRLKDIDGPIANSGAYIDALNPVQGSWKADGSRFIGLLAHEVQEISETPIASGEKDGGEMQAMDYSAPELIANLIAEIQSLRARVAQLEGN